MIQKKSSSAPASQDADQVEEIRGQTVEVPMTSEQIKTVQMLVDALELGLDYAQSELTERKDVYKHFPYRFASEQQCVDDIQQAIAAGRALIEQMQQEQPEFNGWYCSHCERGVDSVEVTFHEQHQECGRVITNDKPEEPT